MNNIVDMNTGKKENKTDNQATEEAGNTEKVKDELHSQPNENTEEAEQVESAEATAQDPLTELQEKCDMLNDKYLRLYSEFENYRRRTAKEKLDMMKNASGDLLKEFLPVVDDFDRAMASNETDENIDNVKEGFKIIHNKLMRIMESKGVKPMDAMEKPFDTEYHEAITNIPAPEESLKGKVVDVAEKGYFYHDSVLRYAKVVVGQ
ncbi:MAG: nucleotide exchange factor GrpE [Cryomorphaceae bacterium]|nr:nucleotide exchange factor GrpE [Flavobacteriales bacterium]